jgi:hypothetical protein
VKLTVAERFAVLGVLPEQGDFLTLKVLRQLREALSFDEDEMKFYSFEEEGDRLYWDESKSEDTKDFEFGDKQTELIVNALKKLDTQKQLTEEHFSIYTKFVQDKGDGAS